MLKERSNFSKFPQLVKGEPGLNLSLWDSAAQALNSMLYSTADTTRTNGSLRIFCNFPVQFSSVQSPSHVKLFETPAARQASLSFTNSQSLLKLMVIESAMPSNHLILCHPLLPPSIFTSISVSSNESVLRIRWPKYWSFSFIINPPNEYSGLISFRIDWLDLPAVQGTLKSLLQHHSSKASILWFSAFFMIQLAHPYMTTGTNHSFDYMDFCQQTNVSAF